MIPMAPQVGDDVFGQQMTIRPEYNGKVGTVAGIIREVVLVNGVPISRPARYLVIWADGARSSQFPWQIRYPTIEEEAESYAHMADVLLRFM